MKGLVDYINEAASIDDKITRALKSKESFCLFCKQTKNNENHLNHLVKNNGYDNVIRVYLDKAEPEDISGIPSKGGKIYPQWMKEIIDNKNSQYVLVFCGEKKEFTSELYNALMPIVLDNDLGGKKCDNFIVCFSCTESLQDDMPKPMKSRFAPNFFTV